MYKDDSNFISIAFNIFGNLTMISIYMKIDPQNIRPRLFLRIVKLFKITGYFVTLK